MENDTSRTNSDFRDFLESLTRRTEHELEKMVDDGGKLIAYMQENRNLIPKYAARIEQQEMATAAARHMLIQRRAGEPAATFPEVQVGFSSDGLKELSESMKPVDPFPKLTASKLKGYRPKDD
jgi:hypothetical protein